MNAHQTPLETNEISQKIGYMIVMTTENGGYTEDRLSSIFQKGKASPPQFLEPLTGFLCLSMVAPTRSVLLGILGT